VTPEVRSPEDVRSDQQRHGRSSQRSPSPGTPKLRDELVTAHLGLAHQLARRFANRGETFDDLFQVASLAVVKSVDRFDPDRGVEFSTFATRTVIGELKAALPRQGLGRPAPVESNSCTWSSGTPIGTLSQELGRSPLWPSWRHRLERPKKPCSRPSRQARAIRTSSIDVPDRQEETLANRLGQRTPSTWRSMIARCWRRPSPSCRLVSRRSCSSVSSMG